jgi:hypothetical protein
MLTATRNMAELIPALHIYSVLYIIGYYNWIRNSPVQIDGDSQQLFN